MGKLIVPLIIAFLYLGIFVEVKAEPQLVGKIYVGEFALGTSTITNDMNKQIFDGLGRVSLYQELSLKVFAHADSSGSEEANKRISEARLAAVAKALREIQPEIQIVESKAFIFIANEVEINKRFVLIEIWTSALEKAKPLMNTGIASEVKNKNDLLGRALSFQLMFFGVMLCTLISLLLFRLRKKQKQSPISETQSDHVVITDLGKATRSGKYRKFSIASASGLYELACEQGTNPEGISGYYSPFISISGMPIFRLDERAMIKSLKGCLEKEEYEEQMNNLVSKKIIEKIS